MSFKERLEVVLRELAAKFAVRDSRGILLTPELAHSDFAEMIGSSRPMVTRLMAEMAKEGRLLRQGKQLILRDSLTGESSNGSDAVKEPAQNHHQSPRKPAFAPIGRADGAPAAANGLGQRANGPKVSRRSAGTISTVNTKRNSALTPRSRRDGE